MAEDEEERRGGKEQDEKDGEKDEKELIERKKEGRTAINEGWQGTNSLKGCRMLLLPLKCESYSSP